MYHDHQFQMVQIIVGALFYGSKCLNLYMNSLDFDDKEIKIHVNKIQYIVSSDTVKTWKRF